MSPENKQEGQGCLSPSTIVKTLLAIMLYQGIRAVKENLPELRPRIPQSPDELQKTAEELQKLLQQTTRDLKIQPFEWHLSPEAIPHVIKPSEQAQQLWQTIQTIPQVALYLLNEVIGFSKLCLEGHIVQAVHQHPDGVAILILSSAIGLSLRLLSQSKKI